MKRFPAIQYLLLVAALLSGAMTIAAQFRLCDDWSKAPAEVREDMVLGMFGPTIRKVSASVPENDGILLSSGIDPALFPYALFPRNIWQLQTDPDTNYIYMDLPPSEYGRKDPAELPVGWRLDIRQDDFLMGGELTRIQPHGSLK